jgi:hypothetical protein
MKKFIIFCIVMLICIGTFVSCSGNEEYSIIDTVSEGEYTFELYGNGDTVRRIVAKKQEKTLCVLQTQGKNFALVDLNFDGHADIRLDNDKKSDHYVCYLFQPTVESFTHSAMLSEMLNPTWNYDTKRVTSLIRIVEKADTAQEDGKTEYKEIRATAEWGFISGQPVQLSEVGVEYFSDTHTYCRYECRYIDGALTRDSAADKWYFGLAELKADGYDW